MKQGCVHLLQRSSGEKEIDDAFVQAVQQHKRKEHSARA